MVHVTLTQNTQRSASQIKLSLNASFTRESMHKAVKSNVLDLQTSR